MLAVSGIFPGRKRNTAAPRLGFLAADEEGTTYQIRALSDGSRHEVLKNFPTPGQLCGRIEPVAEKCEPSESKHFWMVEYTLK